MILMDFRPVLVISGNWKFCDSTGTVRYNMVRCKVRYRTGSELKKKKMKKGSDIHTYSHTHTRDNVSIIYRNRIFFFILVLVHDFILTIYVCMYVCMYMQYHILRRKSIIGDLGEYREKLARSRNPIYSYIYKQ